MTVTSTVAEWYHAVSNFSVEKLFSRKREPGPKRTVWVNSDVPDDYRDAKGRVKKGYIFPNNQVLTSKYTLVTFIPRNLLEQFRRVANVFFFFINFLQIFSIFSTISPGLVFFPLIVILAITAGKDGYEDFKRHQSDRRVNSTPVRILAGGDWSNANTTQSKEKTFVRRLIPKRHGKQAAATTDPEEAPSSSSSSTSSTHASDDDFPDMEFDYDTSEQSPTQPHWKRTSWEDVRVGDFIKITENESIPADILICATSEDENVAFVETKNLDGETNLKSRHAVPELAFFRSAADCVNRENKFSVDCPRPDSNMFKLNAKVDIGHKQHPVDITMTLLRGTVLRNTRWVIGVILFTGEDTKIVLNAGGTPSKTSRVERQMNPQVAINLVLLGLMAIACAIVDSVNEHRDVPAAPWLYDDNRPGDNPSINGLITLAFAFITFQNIIPISLYISIEFVRTAQALFIYFDYDIWYEKNNQAAYARTWNLTDDLGQIEYIFSDKTGTLTQNQMIFRECSVGGKCYAEDEDPENEKEAPVEPRQETNGVATTNGDAVSSSSSNEKEKASVQEDVHFHSSELAKDVLASLDVDLSSDGASRARILNGFFTCLALCHTALAAENPKTGKLEYKAQSPDEAALVSAAADVGYVFKGRDREILSLQKPVKSPNDEAGTTVEKYELLNILDFTSARKRMSVVVKRLDSDDGRLFLLSKGADSVIFERLKKGSDENLRSMTEMHLSEFAGEGLRTLTLAYKVIPADEYEAWAERYHQASVALDDREAQLDAVSDELERDLRLLGATAIEDSLQDGVPETIADLKRAGIKVWVLTGDKLETAIAIGHSTNLIARDSNLIIVRSGSATRPVYQQLVHAAESFFPDSDVLEGVDTNFDGVDDRPSMSSPSQTDLPSSRPTHRRSHTSRTGASSLAGSNNGNRPGGFVLVIEGNALGVALGDEKHKALLLRLAMECEGVICCRVSPLQKALVVRLVKDGLKAMTLAIGDGANDVSMIQAADVGVGISGEEGLQAVNASDYAIAQFRFLKKLLLVHGHWSYARNGNMILNFFYKNIVGIGVLWWFQIYDAWSSAYAFEYIYLLLWNAFWTIAPVIAIGIFDRIIDSDVLMAIPELYRYSREGSYFGLKLFWLYMLDGLYQSAVIFFFIAYTYMVPTTRLDGYDPRQNEMSTTMAFAAVLTANFFNGLNTTAWTGWVWFAVLLGPVLIYAFSAVYNAISPGWFATNVYGNNTLLFHSAYYWLCLPLAIALALLPRYVSKAHRVGFQPNDIDTMRWFRRKHPNRDLTTIMGGANDLRRRSTEVRSSMSHSRRRPYRLSSMFNGSRTDMATGIRTMHRGFDFATEENGVEMRRIQSNLSERRASSIRSGRKSTQRNHLRKVSEGVGNVLSNILHRKNSSG